MVLSVYIDFSHEIKRQTGWELRPDGQVYVSFNSNNKSPDFDYVDILKFLEYEVIPRLERELQVLLSDKRIRIRHQQTNAGSIELILIIYGAYASINDFIETSKRIRDFIDRYVHSNVSNRYGSYFSTNTTFASPMPVQYGFDFNTVMITITGLISIFTVGVLYTFSFNFISKVIVSGSLVALFLALIIELSKITTTYYVVYASKNSNHNKSYGRLNQAVRVFAIILSSLFCLSEISEINTAPNLETYKDEKINNIDNKLKVDSEIITKRYDDENSTLIEQIVSVDKPTVTRRNSTTDYQDIINNNATLNTKISKNNQSKVEQLGVLRANTEKEKSEFFANILKNPEINSKKINTILATVFNVPLNSDSYAMYYRYFIIISSLLVTLLVETISIISMQSISYIFIHKV